MNVSVAAGSALAVLAAVMITALLALALTWLYLSNQEKQRRLDEERRAREARRASSSAALKELLGALWAVDDTLAALSRAANGQRDDAMSTWQQADSNAGRALLELSAAGGMDRIVDSYRELRRTVDDAVSLSKDQEPGVPANGTIEQLLREAREQTRAVDLLVRDRLAGLE
jgi:type II secretory pathway pseudopilin PulG